MAGIAFSDFESLDTFISRVGAWVQESQEIIPADIWAIITERYSPNTDKAYLEDVYRRILETAGLAP